MTAFGTGRTRHAVDPLWELSASEYRRHSLINRVIPQTLVIANAVYSKAVNNNFARPGNNTRNSRKRPNGTIRLGNEVVTTARAPRLIRFIGQISTFGTRKRHTPSREYAAIISTNFNAVYRSIQWIHRHHEPAAIRHQPEVTAYRTDEQMIIFMRQGMTTTPALADVAGHIYERVKWVKHRSRPACSRHRRN